MNRNILTNQDPDFISAVMYENEEQERPVSFMFVWQQTAPNLLATTVSMTACFWSRPVRPRLETFISFRACL